MHRLASFTRLTVFVSALLFASACASATLSPAGANVKMNKSDPPAACNEVGSVSARTAYDLDGAKNMLRNDAAEKGGNYVRLDSMRGEYHLTGTAFTCPSGAVTPPAAPSAEPGK
jgi:hypothetical protein